MQLIRTLNSITLLWLVLLAAVLSNCSSVDNARSSKRQFALKKLWIKPAYDGQMPAFIKLHRMTPILTDSGLLISSNGYDGIAAFDPQNGRTIWRKYIKNGVEKGATLYNDKLYLGANDGQFYCLEAKDGNLVWTFPTHTETLAKPLVSNNTVFFLAGNNILYAINALTGKRLWLYSRQDPNSLSIRGGSEPALNNGKLFVGFSDGAVVALEEGSGKVIWEQILNRNQRFRDIDSSPIIDGKRIYVSGYDDHLYCLNSDDGKIIWKVEGGGYSPVVIKDNHLYYATTSGRVWCLDKISGSLIWEIKLTKGIATKPILFRELAVFGESSGQLYFVDALTGKTIKSFEPGWGLFAAPTINKDNNTLYFISNSANIFALEMRWMHQLYLPIIGQEHLWL